MPSPTNRRNSATRNGNVPPVNGTKGAKAPNSNPKKDLMIEIVSINPETSFYTRQDGSEMERQTGVGFCEAINADVVITRSLFDKDGNEKAMISDSHIGKEFKALVSKVTMENGDVVFFAEISLGRGSASEESINLFDSL